MTSMGQNHKLPGVLLNRHFLVWNFLEESSSLFQLKRLVVFIFVPISTHLCATKASV